MRWPKLVLVDLDQTLIDTLYRFYLTLEEMLEAKMSWWNFLHLFREDRLDDIVPEPKSVFWSEFTRRMSEKRTSLDRVYPGAVEVLSAIRAKKAVVTGRNVEPELVWDELMEFGLAHLFDRVYTGHSGGWRKDDVLRRALEDFKVRANEAVMVGDYWVDVASAKALGIKVIAVRTGLEPDERLLSHGADVIVDGIWEVERAILLLRRGLRTST